MLFGYVENGAAREMRCEKCDKYAHRLYLSYKDAEGEPMINNQYQKGQLICGVCLKEELEIAEIYRK
jgi:hypothetical protein